METKGSLSSIYYDNGYKDRADYLRQLADEHGLPLHTVQMLADVLGENEDFDGLVVACQDAEASMGDDE